LRPEQHLERSSDDDNGAFDVSDSAPLLIAIPAGLFLASVLAFLVYAAVRYAPIIGRVFEEKPLFLPLRVSLAAGGEEVRFQAVDGLELAGTYFRAKTRSRAGVLIFCHEYLSDRWSFQPYAEPLRALGYDIFTFDFRNHGESSVDPTYKPLQWVTDHEVNDLRGAIRYLRSRPDRDSAGFGLVGVSRGGGTALVVGAGDRGVWGVITDGAFPTSGTMVAYILRWAEIYVANPFFWKAMPHWVFRFVGWAGRVRSEKRLHCRFPAIERAAARLAPRPWLMIHGEKDAYILPSIARSLYNCAREPKVLWIVPKAKHNQCLTRDPAEYQERVVSFLRKYAPRRETSAAGLAVAPVPAPSGTSHNAGKELTATSLPGGLAAQIPG
jgi:pimeloyl-ACP methyl ester carboxylesterase